ncbi:MAG: thioredoxin family protein [Muribaculaceae bacterium]|nr:thioredoxin family protein [Muribaculaceae bacterium]
MRLDSVSPTAGVLRFTAHVASGYHIYGTELPQGAAGVPTQIDLKLPEGVSWDGAVSADRAPVMEDGVPVWSGTVTVSRAFKLSPGAGRVQLKGRVRYMACTGNQCTPPGKYLFDVHFGGATPPAAAPAVKETAQNSATVPALPVVTAVADASDIQPESAAGSSALVTENAVAATDALTGSAETPASMSSWWDPVSMPDVEGGSEVWWMILLVGFGGGLLALLTPCVWPMIPMTVSFFLKKGRSRRRSVADALTYGLSIIVIYLVLGIAITALFGAGKLNEIATSAVFNIIFFVLLVVFAISFLGAFDIKLPSRWSNAMDSRAEETTGLLSIFFMAFTLVLVSFSCTGPIIGTLLVEAASQGSILGPAIGMGGFALGLALPFAVFAFFPSLLKEMPRSGGWMNSVKVILGFIELILSLKFLSVADLAYGWHILDREVFLSLWIVLFTLLGLYLLGKLRFSHDAPSTHTGVAGFFGGVVSLAFAVYLLPGLWGAPLKSISAFAPPLSTQDFNLYGGTFREFHDYDQGMEYAREQGLPVLLDFSGYACVNCREMEGAVFDTPEVRDIIEKNFVMIKLMVDDKTELPEAYTVTENGRPTLIETVGERWSYLQRHKFGTNSQPYYVILDNAGQPLVPARAYDKDAAKFTEWLNAGAEAYQTR